MSFGKKNTKNLLIDMKIILTGAAGFIGFHTTKFLCRKNIVVGIDNLNNYYDLKLKKIDSKNSKN